MNEECQCASSRFLSCLGKEYHQEKHEHEMIDDLMPEEGVDYPIKRCVLCGHWGSA